MAVVWAVVAVGMVAVDLLRFRVSAFKKRVELAAEALMLRKQLAMLEERLGRPRVRLRLRQRCSLALLSRLCNWREAIVVVKPRTVMRWRRAGFRLFWRWKCRSNGRPSVPPELRPLPAKTKHAPPKPWHLPTLPGCPGASLARSAGRSASVLFVLATSLTPDGVLAEHSRRETVTS
jgi:hypothetical protein